MNGSGRGYTCFDQIEHDASACLGFPSILLTEYWIIAGLLLGYCQFRICGTAGAAADLKRNAGDPHP